MNNQVFFDTVRKRLFSNKLSAEQSAGLTPILSVWEERGTRDRRHLAYILATAFHETGARMIPVREGQGQRKLWSDAQARRAVALLFKKGKISRDYALPGSYGNSYYGRGLAQITHEDNYLTLGKLIGVDLVRYPDKALEPAIAAAILIEGSLRGVSLRGDFTKYSLEDFIYGDVCDYVACRKVINGTDRAADVAKYAVAFEFALTTADYPHVAFVGTGKKAKVPKVSPLRLGKDQLARVQQTLKDKGYTMVGKVDGLWGENTEDAILAFRRKNKMPLTTSVDDDFLAALWSGESKGVTEERASAKLKDLKGVVPGATEVSNLKKVAGLIGVPSITAGATLSTDDITGITTKINAVKELMAILPSPMTLLAVGVGAAVVYFVVTRVGSKLVHSYREGKIT